MNKNYTILVNNKLKYYNLFGFLFFLLIIAFTSSSFAQVSWLDPTFNSGKTAYYGLSEGRNAFYDLAVLNDGSFLLAAEVEKVTWDFQFGVIKVDNVGKIDSSFGENGIAYIQFESNYYDNNCRAIGIQSDNKIIVAGYERRGGVAEICRLNSNGKLDSTFGESGKVIIPMDMSLAFSTINDLVILADDRFYVAGRNSNSYIHIMLFSKDGVMDTTFGENGYAKINVGAGIDEEEVQLLVQDDGKIICLSRADNYNIVSRFNTDGTPDESYGNSGVVYVPFEYTSVNSEPSTAALQKNGKLVVAGTIEKGSFFIHHMTSVRLNTDGTIDSSYGNNGYSEIGNSLPTNTTFKQSEGRFILVDENDFVYLGGRKTKSTGWWNFLIERYSPDGKLDNSFADNGFAYTGGGGINGEAGAGETISVMRWSGKNILAGGEFYIHRFLTDEATSISNRNKNTELESFKLIQNYPNPFNPTTNISFSIPVSGNVVIKVYDILGNEIEELINEEFSAGENTIKFNSESSNRNISSGVYFYQMRFNNSVVTKKMNLIK